MYLSLYIIPVCKHTYFTRTSGLGPGPGPVPALAPARLTLGDMFKNEVSKNHKNGSESGPGGSVWAETLSKRRPEAQDHFPSPPGPKKQI